MEKINFSVDKISFIEDVKNTQFGVFKLYAFASGNNAHDLPVSVSTLKKTAYTIYNKPVVWKYEWFTDDAGGHEEDEVPCGFVYKEENPIAFKKLKDGRIMLVVNALIWKKYSGKLMEIFQRDDSEKSVSVEIEVFDTQERKDGKTELLDFVYTAITILGEKLTPAVPLARAEVIQFSKDRDDYKEVYNQYFEHKYEDIDFKIPKKIKNNITKGFELKAENNISVSTKILSIARFLNKNDYIDAEKVQRFYSYIPNYNFSEIEDTNPPTKDYVASLLCGGKEGVSWMNDLYNDVMNEKNNKVNKYFVAEEDIASKPSLKVDKSEDAMVTSSWGVVDKSKLKKDVIMAKNFKSIADDVFMKLEDGWKDGTEGSLKYPVMQIKNGTLVYNRYGLSSALAYAKKENESGVVSKVTAIMNKLNIGEEDTKKNMSNIKFTSQTYEELREKIGNFLCDFKDENGYCKFYLVDVMIEENRAIVRDMESNSYFEVEYKDDEDGLSMYLEDSKEVKNRWTTDFSAEEDKKEEEEKEEDKEEDMSKEPEEKEEDKEAEMSDDKEDDKEDEKAEMSDEEKEGEEDKEDEKEMSDDADADDDKKEEDMSDEEEKEEDMSETPTFEELSEMCKTFSEKIEALEAENKSLMEYKNSVNLEKKNFEVESTIKEVIEKCPNMPTSEVEKFRAESIDFSLDNLDTWKNAVKAKAWSFSTVENKKDGIAKIGIDFSVDKTQGGKKSLWD